MKFEKYKLENLSKIKNFESRNPVLDNSWDGTVSFFPRYIQIEHTTRCNARCIMCNHLYTGNRGASDIDINVLQGIEDILKYVETVMLNGDGEPFLYANIEQSLELFRKYEIKIGTNTNFTVVPEKVWQYIANDFSFLNISCDGSTEELYEKIRRGLSFSDFIENLEKVNKIAPNLRKNMDCVLMRQNIGDMENLVKLASDYGFSSIRFHVLGVNPVIGNEKDSPNLYSHYLAEHIKAAEDEAKKLNINVQLPKLMRVGDGSIENDLRRITDEEHLAVIRILDVENYNERLSQHYLGELVDIANLSPAEYDYGDMCKWAIERCYIDLNGNMTTCCYDINHRYGNLKDQSFIEIWNGELYKKLRREFLQGRLPKWCQNCQWLKNPKF